MVEADSRTVRTSPVGWAGLPSIPLLASRPGLGRQEEMVGLTVCIIVVVLLVILLVWICIWVYRDANSRGMNGGLWVAIVIVGGLIGLILYFVIRDDKLSDRRGAYYNDPLYYHQPYQQPYYQAPYQQTYQQPYQQPYYQDPYRGAYGEGETRPKQYDPETGHYK